MKIGNSAISMQSRHGAIDFNQREESLNFWIGQESPRPDGRSAGGSGNGVPADSVVLSDQAKAMLAQAKSLLQQKKEVNSTSSGDRNILQISDKDKLKIAMIEKILQAITGKKIKIRVMDVKLKDLGPDLRIEPRNIASSGTLSQGWGLRYEYHESHYEQEKVSFSSQGVIKTADGREIDFSVQLNMSREFVSEKDISIRAGDAAPVDPLVINMDGGAPGLTNSKFSFDLDSDGSAEQISFARPGSGFLALDLNGDGAVNNGGELFGPSTGNGFSELARYDEDGNGWIDENDPIFNRLRIWTKDEAGNDMLFALGQKGIGAIYLGNVSTPFSMRDGANSAQGQLTQSGIFVREDGTVGTVHQLNLVV